MKRNRQTAKYHFCQRCGDRCDLLTEMRWQGGLLLCIKKCIDTGVFPLIGDRDAEIARLVSTYGNSQELQPDKILTQPTPQQEDDVSFSI